MARCEAIDSVYCQYRAPLKSVIKQKTAFILFVYAHTIYRHVVQHSCELIVVNQIMKTKVKTGKQESPETLLMAFTYIHPLYSLRSFLFYFFYQQLLQIINTPLLPPGGITFLNLFPLTKPQDHDGFQTRLRNLRQIY